MSAMRKGVLLFWVWVVCAPCAQAEPGQYGGVPYAANASDDGAASDDSAPTCGDWLQGPSSSLVDWALNYFNAMAISDGQISDGRVDVLENQDVSSVRKSITDMCRANPQNTVTTAVRKVIGLLQADPRKANPERSDTQS